MARSTIFWHKMIAVICIMMSIVIFTSCRTTNPNRDKEVPSEPQYGGTLNIAVGSISTLDGHAESSDEPMTRHIYETVLALDKDYMPTRGVCSYELSDDFLKLSLKVRDGLLFHDGTKVTAEDVGASIQRWIDMSVTGISYVGKYLMDDGTGIVILDESSLELNFASVASAALGSMGFEFIGPFVKPKWVCEKYGTEVISDDADFIGTGPYKLVEWVRDSHVKMDRFEEYVGTGNDCGGPGGDKKAYADTIIFHFVSDQDAGINGVLSNTYDLYKNVNYTIYQTQQDNPDVKFEIINDGVRPTMVLNKAMGWTANKTFRQAVLAVIDCDAVMTAAFGTPELYKLESSWAYGIGSDLYNQGDMAKCKRLLEECGYDGEEVVYLTMESGYYHDVAVVAVEQMKQAGINVRLDIVDQAQLYSMRSDPTTFSFFSVGFSEKTDPAMIAFLGDGWPGLWVNDQKTEILDKMAQTMDLDEKKVLWKEMTDLIYDDVPVVLFGIRANCTMVSWRTMNAQHVGGEPYYWNVWLIQ